MSTSITRQFPHVQMTDLAEIRSFVAETAVSLSADPDAVSELILAMNEAITNIIVHGYAQPGAIEIALERQGDHLIVCLRDAAPPFDPTTMPPPDVTLPLAQRPFGGMGIHMMRIFTDEMRYQLTTRGQNELILIKQCTGDNRS